MRRLSLIALGLVCVLAAAVPGRTMDGPPRFTFRKGDRLSYHVSFSSKASKEGTAYSGTMEGEAEFSVRRVLADATAEILVTTSGKGSISYGGESVDMEGDAPAPIVVMVAPNGAVTEVRDTNGGKTSFLENMSFAVPAALQLYALGTYTMFGLQLPEKLPAVGGKWTGYHKHETGHGIGEEMRIELKSRAVTFTYVGESDYKGRKCLRISSSCALEMSEREGKTDVPGTYYFDRDAGVLVGLEIDAKQMGADKAELDYSVVLTKVEVGS